MPARQAFLNGAWIDEAALAISVNDPGFALGVTITERLRTFNGRVWRQSEHVERLRRSAAIVGIDPSVADEIDAAITEWSAQHEPSRAAGDDWSITVFATPGVGGEPTRCVHGFPLPFQDWVNDYTHGVALRTTATRQTPPSCWPPELKCRSRMHYYLADREAATIEPGARALLLDQEGFVGEASTANVVAYRADEGIISPPMEKVLPGISVAVLAELAESAGVRFVQRDLTAEEVRSADEVWLASTSICLAPVVRCDGEIIGAGKPGDVYYKMLKMWDLAVGLDIVQQAQSMATKRHGMTRQRRTL